ncbi:MAG: cation:proton antiporter [Ahrensia sp.]|nr:cation:proton antiporter [Ahrensia sp.]
MTTGLLVLAVIAFGFALIAKRVTTSIVTAPMVFILFGLAMSQTGLLKHPAMEETLHLVAEITLVLLLFLDASRTNFGALRQRFVWPARMLIIGLPLAIVIGSVVGAAFLTQFPLPIIVLVAAILSPTDAALGQAVISNEAVPERTRRALTVESGLNDGLALPLILFIATLCAQFVSDTDTDWIAFGAKQIILGPLVGIVVGVAGAKLMAWADENGYTADIFEGVGVIALAMSAFLAANLVGGNGFISAFVAGLCFGGIMKNQCEFIYEFAEGDGQALTWMAFFLIGLLLVPEALHSLDVTTALYILASLFVVRPLAIYISLIGTDATTPTRLFFGWFGPRGLATALFALMVVDSIVLGFGEEVLHVAINAVLFSTILHGLSAAPLAELYASRFPHEKRSRSSHHHMRREPD